jgi:hypothetical protein
MNTPWQMQQELIRVREAELSRAALREPVEEPPEPARQRRRRRWLRSLVAAVIR